MTSHLRQLTPGSSLLSAGFEREVLRRIAARKAAERVYIPDRRAPTRPTGADWDAAYTRLRQAREAYSASISHMADCRAEYERELDALQARLTEREEASHATSH